MPPRSSYCCCRCCSCCAHCRSRSTVRLAISSVWQSLHTRSSLASSCGLPSATSGKTFWLHGSQNTSPQKRQWCFHTKNEKGVMQSMHVSLCSSGVHSVESSASAMANPRPREARATARSSALTCRQALPAKPAGARLQFRSRTAATSSSTAATARHLRSAAAVCGSYIAPHFWIYLDHLWERMRHIHCGSQGG